MAKVRKSSAGSGYVDLIGRIYTGSIRVDKEGKKFLNECSNKIWFDSHWNSWKYQDKQIKTTLSKKIYSVMNRIPIDKINGKIVFINKDKSDFRLKNLKVN